MHATLKFISDLSIFNCKTVSKKEIEKHTFKETKVRRQNMLIFLLRPHIKK